jgi:multicomponent Na+:H+ antiporter subunit D
MLDTFQLLSFAALAFCLLILSGLHPVEMRVILLDADWFYRKGGKVFYRLADRLLGVKGDAGSAHVVGTDREVIRGS